MTIFSIIATQEPASILKAARDVYGDDLLVVAENAFLVSDNSTAIHVTQKLGLVSDEKGRGPTKGSALITSVGSYYGLANPNIWEWIKSKLEGGNG